MSDTTATTQDMDALDREAAEAMGWALDTDSWWKNRDTKQLWQLGCPRPTRYYDAALKLLEFAQSLRGPTQGQQIETVGAVTFKMYRNSGYTVEWSVWRGPDGFAESDSLPVAITQACLAALRAVRELEK